MSYRPPALITACALALAVAAAPTAVAAAPPGPGPASSAAPAAVGAAGSPSQLTTAAGRATVERTALGSPTSPYTAAARASLSYLALKTRLAAADGSGLYREQVPPTPDDPRYSYEWPFSQAHVAALDLTAMVGIGPLYRPSLAAHDAAQEHYWEPTSTTGLPGYASGAVAPRGSGGDLFYDDNEWVGLQDVQHHTAFGDAASLRRARQISDLVDSGWDGDPSHAAPGGVFWTQAPWSSARNTVSNMPGAELDARLFQITGEHRYLDRALRYYRWTNAHLQRPDGLYSDNLGLDGKIDPTVWSYNQGVPVGVDVRLYQATGDRAYLTEARRVADAAYRYFVTEGRLDSQPPYFNSIFFKNLLLLESVTGGHTYRQAMAGYAQRVWTQHRDASTGLFDFPEKPGTSTLEQAAMVQLYAVLAWPTSRYGELY